ncbi:MAG: GNAT family N-acetyltransferase [Candidatus Dadabacteria bacterium]
MQINWLLKKFDDLTPHELYAILQLRSEVFVVEQNCVYPDADDKDQYSWHLMGWHNNKLIAYTRLIPAGKAYEYCSIGRVVSSPSVRRSGAGKELMTQSIEKLYELFGKVPIKIGAQLYLQQFYESFGFKRVSDVYLEDGIDHIYMIKQPT